MGLSDPKEPPLKACLLAACLVLAACAAAPAEDPLEEKRYATGSNIPLRDRAGVRTMTPEGFENARNSAAGNTGRAPSN